MIRLTAAAAGRDSRGCRRFRGASNVVISRPVSGFAMDLPRRLDRAPHESGIRATRYKASSELNGFLPGSPARRGVARKTEPLTCSESDGVMILTFPSFDSFGQPWPGIHCAPSWAYCAWLQPRDPRRGRIDRHPFRQRDDLPVQRRSRQSLPRCCTSAGPSCPRPSRSARTLSSSRLPP